MNDQPEPIADSPPERFQFTIANYFEATISVSILLAIIAPTGGLGACSAVLGFFVAKAIITFVAIKRRPLGVSLYLGLWALLAALFLETDQDPLGYILVVITISAFLPTIFLAIDLNRGFATPRALIWRPWAELFGFVVATMAVPAGH